MRTEQYYFYLNAVPIENYMQRNLGHLPIGEYLYRMKFAFDRKIRILAARDYKMKKERALCRYVGPKSQKLIQRIKERGFKQVFDFLDEDKVFP